MTKKKSPTPSKAGLLPVETWRQCQAHPFYETLTEGAKAIYKKKCQELLESGLMSALYLDMLILYAKELDSLARLDKKIEQEGTTVEYTDRYGRLKVVPHPDVKTRKEKVATILELSKRFGYSPKDVKAFGKEGENKEEESPLEKWRRELDADNAETAARLYARLGTAVPFHSPGFRSTYDPGLDDGEK